MPDPSKNPTADFKLGMEYARALRALGTVRGKIGEKPWLIAATVRWDDAVDEFQIQILIDGDHPSYEKPVGGLMDGEVDWSDVSAVFGVPVRSRVLKEDR